MQRFLRAIPLVLPALALAAAPAAACTMRGYPYVQRPGTVFMIATPRAETVVAGPGIRSHPGGEPMSATIMGPPRPAVEGDRPVEGQVFEVERYGGRAAGEVGQAGGRAVLVPWTTHPDCSPRQWTGSAQWAEPGIRGVVVAELRDRSGWVDGIPTFDVRTPWTYPHPHGVTRRAPRPDAPPVLGVDDYFRVLEMLPSAEESRASPARAYAPLFAWATAHPGLARAHPALAILEDAVWEVETERMAGVRPEIAGTYRLELALDGERRFVYHARTAAHPRYPWYSAGRRWDGGPVQAPGHALPIAVATDLAALPATGAADSLPGVNARTVWVTARPEETDGGAAWRADVLFDIVPPAVQADSAITAFEREWWRLRTAMRPADREAGFPLGTGRFIRRRNGAMTVEHERRLPDGRVLRIRGTRISPVTMTETGPG